MRLKFHLVLLGLAWSLVTPCRVILGATAAEPAVSGPAFRQHLQNTARNPIVPGNSIRELINGVEYFPAMLKAISQAQRSVTFENFIWKSGDVSDAFIEALCERARAGVKVHCIVDGFGALRLRSSDIRRMRDCGVEFEIYNQLRPWNCWRWNDRTHRKTLVVDGNVGFIGGICVGDSWAGDADHPDVWRDSEYEVKGPLVAQLQAAFAINWLEVTGEKLTGLDYYPPLKAAGDIEAHAFVSGRRENRKSAREVHLHAIHTAETSIKLAHSYFVPDDEMLDALVAAARRGVEIEIITSGHKLNMVRRASRSTWSELIRAGVRFYEYIPTKYHCKIMIVDGAWVTTGSTNFDDRSFHINDEANINVWNRDFAARQLEVFEEDRSNSMHVDPVEFNNRPFIAKAWERFCGMFRRWL